MSNELTIVLSSQLCVELGLVGVFGSGFANVDSLGSKTVVIILLNMVFHM